MLRDYQIDIAKKADRILRDKGMVYLSVAVRCGKTLMALETCRLFGAKKILFITKIKAFSSIKNDHDNFGYKFDLTIINKESIHKIEDNDFDVIICDEAHGLFGTYPKPNKFTKIYKKRFNSIPSILLSGTMCPEGYSQTFHQFWINKFAPFSKYVNFYRWANEYVKIKVRHLGYGTINDYSDADFDKIMSVINPYIITFTQEQAKFTTSVNETILEVEMKPITYAIIKKLHKDLVVTSSTSGKTILADTSVKLQQKTHQLFSGTIKYEDGTSQVIDDTKALFIANRFKDNKIAILYNFVAELEMLKSVLGDKLTTSLEEFNNSDKWYVGQIVSSREGISLAAADYLVFINLQFSAVSFWQSRDRLSYLGRDNNQVFWIFAKNGIENNIYKTVLNKRDYTLNLFKKDFNIKK